MERQRIVIFGCCGKGREILYSLDEKEYQIVAFLDNAEEKQDTRTWGEYDLESPEDIVNLEYDYVIVALPEYFSEIAGQLQELGVDERKIVNWNTFFPIRRLDSRITLLRSFCERVNRETD